MSKLLAKLLFWFVFSTITALGLCVCLWACLGCSSLRDNASRYRAAYEAVTNAIPTRPAETNAPAPTEPTPEPQPQSETPVFAIQSVTCDWTAQTITPVGLTGNPPEAQIVANRWDRWAAIEWPEWDAMAGLWRVQTGQPTPGERWKFELVNGNKKVLWSQLINQ
jgi:hypothetical protein